MHEGTSVRVGRRYVAVIGGLAALALLIVPIGALSDEVEIEPTPVDQVDAPGREVFEEIMEATPEDELAPVEETTAAERDQTLTEFSELSDGAALALALAEFPDLAQSSLVPELELAADESVSEFLSPTTAVIAQTDVPESPEALPAGLPAPDPGAPGTTGPGLLVESTFPLSAPEGGAAELLEDELIREGDHYEAGNAPVEAALPVDLSDGIELPRSGVTVTPVGSDDTQPVESGNVLFHANADVDTDAMITAATQGASISYQLRSAESPERLPLAITMPAGATLQQTADGGAEVRQGDKAITTITPPYAWDSAGTEVPTHYEVSGERVTIVVDHQEGDYLRPIAVDPLVYDQYNFSTDPNPNVNNLWQVVSTGNPYFRAGYSTAEGGLWLRAHAGSYYTGELVEWVANPIRDSYIERVDFLQFDRRPTTPGSCAFLGIWNTNTYGWAWGTVEDVSSGARVYPTPYLQKCDNIGNDGRRIWAGSSYQPDTFDNTGGDVEAASGSTGIFALSTSGGSRSTTAENLMRSSAVYRFDRNLPWVTGPTAAWTKDPTIYVHDNGLGGWAANIWAGTPQNAVYLGAVVDSCTGAHQQPCDIHTDLHPQLPEGVGTYTALGYDAAGWNSTGITFGTKVDRTPPVLHLGGELPDVQGETTTRDEYLLIVDAEDGDPDSTNPAVQRSGVRSVEIRVDGVQKDYVEQQCSWDSCWLDRDWTFKATNYSQGNHTIRVIAHDQLGHQTAKEITLTVGAVTQTASATTSASTTDTLSCTGAKEPTNFAAYTLGSAFGEHELESTTRTCDPPYPGEPVRANFVAYTYGTCVEAYADDGTLLGCRPPLEIQTWPACERSLDDYEISPGHPFPHKSAGLVRGVPAFSFPGGDRLELYTGSSTVVIFGSNADRRLNAAKAVARMPSGAAPATAAQITPSEAADRRALPEPVAGATNGSLACP